MATLQQIRAWSARIGTEERTGHRERHHLIDEVTGLVLLRELLDRELPEVQLCAQPVHQTMEQAHQELAAADTAL